jgi:hypothetical protein
VVQEQENQTLREQLEEYQRKEREDAARLADALAHDARPAEPDADSQCHSFSFYLISLLDR